MSHACSIHQLKMKPSLKRSDQSFVFKTEKVFLGLEDFSHKNYIENYDSIADFTSQITRMFQLMLQFLLGALK